MTAVRKQVSLVMDWACLGCKYVLYFMGNLTILEDQIAHSQIVGSLR